MKAVRRPNVKVVSRIREGHRIAHRDLDEEGGGAKSGVVEEVIGEEKPRLVVARFEDTGEHEAYDERELVDLGSAKLSEGPVILHPRHIRQLLRFESVRFAFLFLVASALALAAMELRLDWSLKDKLLADAVVIGLCFLVSRYAERRLRRERKAR